MRILRSARLARLAQVALRLLGVAWRGALRGLWWSAVSLAFLLPLLSVGLVQLLSDPWWRRVALQGATTPACGLLAVVLFSRYGGRFDAWTTRPTQALAFGAVFALVLVVFVFPDTRLGALALIGAYALAAGLVLRDRVGSAARRRWIAAGAAAGALGVALAFPMITQTARPAWRDPHAPYVSPRAPSEPPAARNRTG